MSKEQVAPQDEKHPVDSVLSPGKPVVGSSPFLVFFVASLIGLFATGFLTYRHILLTVETGAISESTLCRPSATVNCDAVLQSPEAILFDYFPSSVVGLSGFILLLWFAASGLLVLRLRKIAFLSIIAYLSVAISFSAYFSYLMIFKQNFVCTWCIVVHLVNLAALGLGLAILFKKRVDLERPIASTKPETAYLLISAILAAISVIAAAGWIEKSLALSHAHGKYNKLVQNPEVMKAMIDTSPHYNVPVNDKDPAYGSPDAPYAIVLFTDLQCPVCLRKELFLNTMVDLNPLHLRVVLKNFPLSTDCNKKLGRNLHPFACEAARAAYASFLLAGATTYWKYTDLIFAHQTSLGTKPWFKFASELGLPDREFHNLMLSGSPADRKIQEDIALGLELGLDSTPAIFFLGKRMPEELRGLPFMIVIEKLVRTHYPDRGDFILRK